MTFRPVAVDPVKDILAYACRKGEEVVVICQGCKHVLIDVGMIADGGSAVWPKSGDDVESTRRQPSFDEQLRQQ